MAQFKSFGPSQIYRELSFFGTTAIELTQGVGRVTGVIIPWVTKLLRVFFSQSLSATGTRRSLSATGTHRSLSATGTRHGLC